MVYNQGVTKPPELVIAEERLAKEWDLAFPKSAMTHWPNGEPVHQRINPFAGKGGTRNVRVAELARKYTEEAMMILGDIMRNSKDDRARMSAIKIILDRGHGRVPETIQVEQTTDKVAVLRHMSKNPKVVEAMGLIAREIQSATGGALAVKNPAVPDEDQDPED